MEYKRKRVALKHLDKHSATCKKDWLEAKRHCKTPDHVPKWKDLAAKPSTQAVMKCMYPQCTVTSNTEKIITTKLTEEQILEHLQIQGSPSNLCFLCKKDYNKIYNNIHAQLRLNCGNIHVPLQSTSVLPECNDANETSSEDSSSTETEDESADDKTVEMEIITMEEMVFNEADIV